MLLCLFYLVNDFSLRYTFSFVNTFLEKYHEIFAGTIQYPGPASLVKYIDGPHTYRTMIFFVIYVYLRRVCLVIVRLRF